MSQLTSLDQTKISFMSEKIFENIQIFLDMFDIKYKNVQNYISAPCPIHGGDNPTAFCMYLDGNTLKGNWCCYTHHCEEIFRPTPFGFIRGVLSNKYNNWTGQLKDIKYGFLKTYDFCQSILKIDESNIPELNNIEKRKFCNDIKIFTKTKKFFKGWNLHNVISSMDIPSQYFLNRGYKRETLEHFCVGTSKKNDGIFRDRSIVPVIAQDGIHVVGFTGRSNYEKCLKCNQYHEGSCESKNKNYIYSKWVNNKGFAKERYLYNLHNAIEAAKYSKKIILCEGPADVWSLYEKGIENAVAIFGTSLTDSQQIILETCDIHKIILLLDNDEAGIEAREKIKSSLCRFFNIAVPKYEGKDPGSSNSNLKDICNV